MQTNDVLCDKTTPNDPPLTPQYLAILMTERGGAIIFCRILSFGAPLLPRCYNT